MAPWCKACDLLHLFCAGLAVAPLSSCHDVALLPKYGETEYVSNTHGWLPKQCVHRVPNGTRTRHDLTSNHVHVLYPNGSTEVMPPCPAQIPIESLTPPRVNATGTTGALEWFFYPLRTVSSFEADLYVSAPPSTGPGLSWWIGLETMDFQHPVIQPIVAFSPGLNSWAVTAMNCCPGGRAIVSPERAEDGKVPERSSIHASLRRNSGTDYTISITGNGRTFSLDADNQIPYTVPTIALEVDKQGYSCSDLPGGSVQAQNIRTDVGIEAHPWPAHSGDIGRCGWRAYGSGNLASGSPPSATFV